MTSTLRLFHYWRSSCSWRVRWALDYKKLPVELVHVSLISGESEGSEHRARNPLGYVPVLERLDGSTSSSVNQPQPFDRYLSDSTAILHWLEEQFPERATLLPGDSWTRACIRSMAGIITADTQPVQNLNVLQRHSCDAAEQKKWAQEFIHQGLEAFERHAVHHAGRYSVGDALSWADLCLIPQHYNAERFGVPSEEFPTIRRIVAECQTLESHQSSHPSRYEPQP